MVFGSEDLAHVPEELFEYEHYRLPEELEKLFRLLSDQPNMPRPLEPLRILDGGPAAAKPRFNLPHAGRVFAGRDELLKQFQGTLGKGPVILFGLPGVGKSRQRRGPAQRLPSIPRDCGALLTQRSAAGGGLGAAVAVRPLEVEEAALLVLRRGARISVDATGTRSRCTSRRCASVGSCLGRNTRTPGRSVAI